MARVGCMGRRSPGRRGGRGPLGAPAGRGRWKIGCPGTGRPGAGRPCIPGRLAIGWPGTGGRGGASGFGGAAMYTGRGPVCGVMTRRGGACGWVRTAGAFFAAGGAATTGGAISDSSGVSMGGTDATASGASAASSCMGGGVTNSGGVVRTGGGAAVRGGAMGDTTIGGAISSAGGATGFAGLGGGGTTAGAAGLAAVGGAAGFGGTAAGGGVGRASGGRAGSGCCCCVIAFSTSPGREIFDRSNLVLISGSAGPRAALFSAEWAVCRCAAKNSRTRTASSTSIELECVFFSVTPTWGRTSRMAFDFTSSSRARSLIRIFCCIRPAVPPILSR